MNRFMKMLAVITIGFVVTGSVLSAEDNKEGDDGKSKQGSENEKVRTKKKSSNEIIVKGDVFNESDSAYTVSIIDKNKIKDMHDPQAANIIKAVPGVVMKEYGQGLVSNAVTLRGFTSGVHGDDMGIYLDGIPLNETMGHGGGYADPNIIIPLEIEKVLVYKGPSTAMYGNFSKAGTMAFYTRKKEEYELTSAQFGSFKTADMQAAIGSKMGDNAWNNTAVQFYRTDGYIENTESLMGNASTRFTFNPTEDLEISASLRVHGSDWNGTGYITRDQWKDRDTSFDQRPNAENNGGNRTQFCERVDIGYKLGHGLKANLWGFGSEADWTRYSKSINAVPANEKQVEQGYYVYKAGSGLNVNYIESIVKAIAGMEFYTDGTTYREWKTVERVRQGGKTQYYKNRLDNYVFFTEGEININRYFRPTLGVRLDAFRGKLDYRVKNSAAYNENDSFGLSTYYHVSPKIGVRSTIIEDILDIRGNICNGYAMPKNLTIFVGDDIKPSTIWQYELGATVTGADILKLDAAAFMIDTRDEVQADPTDSGNYYKYKNVGTTRRLGSEISAYISPNKDIEFNGTFSWISTDIKKSRTKAYEGKSLSGLPKYSSQAGAKWTIARGLGIKGDWVYVGKSYLNSTNTETYNGYNLFNAGIFYTIYTANNTIDITAEVKNITNKLYVSTYSANDAGTVTSFSPGTPRSYSISLNTKW